MTTLFYIMDPMCGWCYGFQPVLKEVIQALPDGVELRYVMGGLAPDSDEPMPVDMQQYIQKMWTSIAERTGAKFNFNFWTQCRPRRSTYPACRAVLATTLQDRAKIPVMIQAIQKAYYQEARNPSDNQTLIELARDIELDSEQFAKDLVSPEVEQLLEADFNFRNSLGVHGFPTLVLKTDKYYGLAIGYSPAEPILKRLQTLTRR